MPAQPRRTDGLEPPPRYRRCRPAPHLVFPILAFPLPILTRPFPILAQANLHEYETGQDHQAGADHRHRQYLSRHPTYKRRAQGAGQHERD